MRCHRNKTNTLWCFALETRKLIIASKDSKLLFSFRKYTGIWLNFVLLVLRLSSRIALKICASSYMCQDEVISGRLLFCFTDENNDKPVEPSVGDHPKC